MYLPPHFKQEELPALHGAIRAARLATVVTLGAEGMEASHVPILLDAGEGPYGAIRGHIARANPQWRRVAAETPALAIFLGPDSYVSPSWYPTKQETGKSCRPGIISRSMPMAASSSSRMRSACAPSSRR